MIDTHFYERLVNWRRVYGDKPVRWRSPTDTACRYAQSFFNRAPETEEEKFWREAAELRTRDPLLPAPDYPDAELLQRAWISLPDKVNGTKVKRHVRVFVFGTRREYERLLRQSKVSHRQEPEWRRTFLQAFLDAIERIQKVEREG